MWKTALLPSLLVLLAACATTPAEGTPPRKDAPPKGKASAKGPFSDDRPPPVANDEEIRDFNRVWELYRASDRRWPAERDRLRARSEACGYLLAAHMLRFYQQLNTTRDKNALRLRDVMREVIAIGEPCVPYLVDWMVLDQIPVEGPEGPATYTADDLTRKDCLYMLEGIGKPATPHLLRALERKDLGERGRRLAALALGGTKDPAALEPLVRLLREDPSWMVRADSASALATLGDRRALAPLGEAAKADADPAVRKRAEKARSQILRPTSVPR
jgi:hypothetical protein